jgi:biopolymer transport protein TolQ
LIHAFVRISEQQSADIVAVAPGISEALITTIAGLFVAIPALVFSQYISIRIRQLDFNLSQTTQRVILLAKLSVVHAAVVEAVVPSIKHENMQQ